MSQVLEAAVSADRIEISVAQNNIIHNTFIEDEFAFQSYYGEEVYFLSNFGAEVIRRVMEEDSEEGHG